MKTRKNHIFFSWILLVCFVAGQYMVYAHQHNYAATASKVYSKVRGCAHQSVTDKCSLCDVMHHSAMLGAGNTYFCPVVVNHHFFRADTYNFTSIQLILAGGRAPPFMFFIS